METSILSNTVPSGDHPPHHTELVNVDAVVDDQPDMWGLAVQPLEVLHHIFTYVNVHDIARLSLTCRHFQSCVAHDDILWREQYLKLFDEPIETPQSWQNALRKLLLMKKLLLFGDRAEKEDRLEDVANTAINLITKSRSQNPTWNETFFAYLMQTRSNKSCFLSRSSLFARAGHPLDTPADTEELRQLSAKLHVLYGMDIELDEIDMEAEGAREIHPFARSRVYDLRRYTTKNGWGPLADDGSGRVDWEKAQAIVTVLSCGLRVLSQRFSGIMGSFWGRPFHGLAANSFKGKSFGTPVEDDEDEFAGQDPYNVRGTWMRVVNFLDYHDLFAYNFQPPIPASDQERPPISTKEAIRLIWLQLRVCKIEEAQHGDDPSMPRVHFKGESRSLTNTWDPNANSAIRGYVRKTIHGDIRWTTFSVFGGEERWRSECVQVGEVNSARGTVGNWFDKNYDAHGPAGPTAFWKVSDDIMKARNSGHTGVHALHHHFHVDDEYVTTSDDDDEDDDEEDDEDEEDEEDDGGENINDEGLNGEEQEGEEDAAVQLIGEGHFELPQHESLGLTEDQPSQTEITITVTDGIITAVETRDTS